MHIFIPTVFVAFVRFWHVLRSAVLHLLLRDHFIQITETTNNDPYSSSPKHLGTRILIDTFQRHSYHYPYQLSSYTCLHSDSILVRRDKKKRPPSIQIPFYAGAKKASAAAALRLFLA